MNLSLIVGVDLLSYLADMAKVVITTGSGPKIRGVRLLDESIFSLLIGPPEKVTNIPAQISARGHRASPFFEMNSSDLIFSLLTAKLHSSVFSRLLPLFYDKGTEL